MVSDTGSDTEPYSKPEIRRGTVLPRVGAVPGAERFSPAAASGSGDQAAATEGPRHRRPARSSRDQRGETLGESRSRRRLVLFGGVCAVACVAVASAVAFASVRSAHDSAPSSAGDHGPATAERVPPVPSWATGVQSPAPSMSASASASAHATPTPSAKPHSSASHAGAAPTAAHHWQTVVVHSTYVLNPGDSVHSNRIRLSLLGDGDLVLRDEHDRVTWSTGTHAQGAHAVFQDDGNLVVYRGDQTLWSSRTDGHNGATLVLGADGAMTIVYGNTTLWSTGTG